MFQVSVLMTITFAFTSCSDYRQSFRDV